MQNTKLQELADKLYKDGLSKGQEEAEILLTKAKEEAVGIVKIAEQEAEKILTKARSSAAEIRKNAETEINMTFRQIENEIKQKISKLITAKSVGELSGKAMDDVVFVQNLIKTALSNFNPKSDEIVNFSVLLPEQQKEAFSEFVAENAGKALNGSGLEVSFDRGFRAGFKIGPKDQGYYISFTDKDFENLFASYIRPQLQNLLFGEQ